MSRGLLPVVGLLTLALALATNDATTARAIGLSVAPAPPPVGPWVPGTSQASIVEPGSRPQNLCADCNRLREQLRIVGEKAEVFDGGLQMLRETRRELASNTGAADGIAAAYLILQSLNVAFGLATLPCSVPQQWLRGLVGGAAGLGCLRAGGRSGGRDTGGGRQLARPRRGERRDLRVRVHATVSRRVGRAGRAPRGRGPDDPRVRNRARCSAARGTSAGVDSVARRLSVRSARRPAAALTTRWSGRHGMPDEREPRGRHHRALPRPSPIPREAIQVHGPAGPNSSG